MRVEFVADTKSELEKLKEYAETTICRIKFNSFSIFCYETGATHFFTPRELEEGVYVYKEEEVSKGYLNN